MYQTVLDVQYESLLLLVQQVRIHDLVPEVNASLGIWLDTLGVHHFPKAFKNWNAKKEVVLFAASNHWSHLCKCLNEIQFFAPGKDLTLLFLRQSQVLQYRYNPTNAIIPNRNFNLVHRTKALILHPALDSTPFLASSTMGKPRNALCVHPHMGYNWRPFITTPTWMVALHKKCCCLSRSSFPSYVRSSGYRTLLIVSARCFARIACT